MKGRAARTVSWVLFGTGVAWMAWNVYASLAANPLPVLPVVLGLAGAIVCGVILLVCRDAYMARVPPETRRRHAAWGHLVSGCLFMMPGVLLAWMFLGHPGLLTLLWSQSRSSLLMISAWPAILLAWGVAELVRFFRKRRAMNRK